MKLVTLVCLLSAAFVQVESRWLKRIKRQDWNFPPAGNGGNRPGASEFPSFPPGQLEPTVRPTRPTPQPDPLQPQPDPSRPQPDPSRPQPDPSQPGQGPPEGTLPTSSIVFASPCSRCPTTPQYNPVCGSDARTYVNEGVLDCARRCGFPVTLERLGVCQMPR